MIGMGDIFASVSTRVETACRGSGDAVPNQQFGQQHLVEINEDDPRIVWVPKGGPINGKRQSLPTDAGDNPVPLFQREIGIEAYIWAADPLAAEKLLQHLVAALHRTWAGAWHPRGEKWIEWSPVRETPPKTESWVMGGAQDDDVRILCVLAFDIALPLYAEADADLTGLTEALTANVVPQ